MFDIIESRIKGDPYPYHVVQYAFDGRPRLFAPCPERAIAELIAAALNAHAAPHATVSLAS